MNLLVVVDYQNDFVDGVLGFERAKYLAPVIAKKIEEYFSRGDTVVFVLDTHDANEYQDCEEACSFPPHCIIHEGEGIEDVLDGSKGFAISHYLLDAWDELIDSRSEEDKEVTEDNGPTVHLVMKPTYGSMVLGEWAMSGKTAKSCLAMMGESPSEEELETYAKFDNIEVCGVATHLCVLANAVILQATAPDTPIWIDPDAVSDFDTDLGDKALEVMNAMGIELMNPSLSNVSNFSKVQAEDEGE